MYIVVHNNNVLSTIIQIFVVKFSSLGIKGSTKRNMSIIFYMDNNNNVPMFGNSYFT